MKKLSVRAVCLEVCLLVALAAYPAGAQAGTVWTVARDGNLQAAIDAAAPGDTIQLAVGATYTGNFVLRPKAGAAWITIRTAPDARQPAAGVRVGPAHAPALAKLVSPNSMPAIRTEGPAHHFRLLLLEFGANNQGYGEVVQLGQADSQQTSLSQVPYSLALDRLYIHGDPIAGQKRGVALNSASTDILNCYIAEIKAIGQDAQAIAAMNGPGPYLIQNNYLEAAAENFLAGGVDPTIPNLTPSDITFRYNYLSKPTAWRNPVVPSPGLIAATADDTTGALAAGTYAYRVVAYRMAGQGILARSAASAEVSATLAANGTVSLSWAAVPNATNYRVYGRVPGGATQYWITTGTSFVDTGAAGTAGTVGTGTAWTVKNLFELKNARRVMVERNVMENNWVAAQSGYAVVFTPRNSGGLCTWCAVQDVTFRLNIVRHVSSGMNILGYDNTNPSGQARGIIVRDNLFHDVNKVAWAGNGWPIMMGDGPADIVIDHNTFDHDGTSVIYAYGAAATGVQVTNNLMRHGTYGIFGSSTAYGTATIDGHFPGGVVTSNVFAGGSASRYPAGNLFPTVTSHVAQFAAPASGDYRLVAGSSYAGAALDGKDLGADIAGIMEMAQDATRGANSTVTPVAITTTDVPRGTVGTPMAASFSASSGGAPLAWSLSGSLPQGVSFDATAAALSGVPAEYGAWPVQVTATSVAQPSNSATGAFTVSIWPLPVTVESARLPVQLVGRSATAGVSASGATGSYRWRVVDGAIPPGLTLGELTGVFTGTPTTAGSFAFTVEAADLTYPDLTGRGNDVVDVVPPPVKVVTQALGRGTQGASYGATLDASGGAGSIVWTIASGSLPPGLSLSSAGSISGNPSAVGSWTFGVRATDSLYATNAASATLAIDIAPALLQIATTMLPEAWRTLPYSTVLKATGGTGAISWRVIAGTLPPGLVLSSTGVLSGATRYTGQWTFTLEARDSGSTVQVATRQYTFIGRTKTGW